MRSVFCVVALGAVLVACGGGGGGGTSFTDPDSLQFTYDSYLPVSAYDGTSDAAGAGMVGATDTMELTAASDDGYTQSLANLPDTMAGDVFDSNLPAVVQAQRAQARMSRLASAYATGDLVAATQGFDNPACVSIDTTHVHYTGCVYTDPGDGTTITLSGLMTRSDVDVTWDASVAIHMTFVDPAGNVSVTVGSHLVGLIAVSPLDVNLYNVIGAGRSDTGAAASGQGHYVAFSFTHKAYLDLVYQAGATACVVGGSVELKRAWSNRPTGYTAADLPNQGIKFVWGGCGSIQYAWGH